MDSDLIYTVLAIVLGLFLVVVAFVIFFIPAIIAYKRRHRNFMAILVVNIFLGWSLLGWVVALIWAVYKEKDNAS